MVSKGLLKMNNIIYIQHEEEEKTWCEDKINDSDLKYFSEDFLIEYLKDQIKVCRIEQAKFSIEKDPSTHLALEASIKTVEVLIEELTKKGNK